MCYNCVTFFADLLSFVKFEQIEGVSKFCYIYFFTSHNITLIGMPTSGKSTVGVILAKILGMDFVDTDLIIQRKAGKRLANIIAEDGLEGFLSLEEEVCAELEAENTVIATGGSVVYGEKAMAHLKDISHVVYLEIDYETLEKRLHHVKQRETVQKIVEAEKLSALVKK